MIKTWIFDLDGTLYDYERCNRYAELSLFSMMNNKWEVDPSECGKLLRNAKKIVKERLGAVAASHNRMLYMQNICEQLGVKSGKYALELYEVYWSSFFDHMEIYPDMKRLLYDVIAGEGQIVLLTDMTVYIQLQKVIRLGIEDAVDYIITSEETGAEKPCGIMFQRVLDKTGKQREEMLMIGDDLVKDVQGAERFGIRAMLFRDDCSFYEEVRQWL